MVDFKAALERSRASMTPEERARVAEHEAREARFNLTRGEVVAHFERSEMRRSLPPIGMLGRRVGTARREAPERVVVAEWTRPIPVRIEERPSVDGPMREVISFKEAVTGYETFHLDEEFVRLLVDPEELRLRPRFYVCAGTPGRWDACWVDPSDVEAYLRERRPSLFEPASATPAP